MPTRIAALETAVAALNTAFGNFATASENVAAPVSTEFHDFVDGLFSKYFRGEWEAFKAKLAAKANPPA